MKWMSIVVFSIAVISCSNVTLEKEPIVIDSVKDGAVLSTGDIFQINIDKSSDSAGVAPTSTKVYIERITDGSRGNSGVIPIELEVDLKENPNPQFKITDDFEDGLYNLTIHVYEDDEVISEKVTEFIIFSGLLKGDVLASYPSKLYSGSKVILKTDIKKDPSLNPYIIWRYDNKVIDMGYLNDGLDSLVWDSGSVIGFNNVRADLYPYKLSDSKILSDKYIDFSILVNPVSKKLYSSESLDSYYKYMFFNGNYIDEKNKLLLVKTVGELNPRLKGDFYGISIDEARGFSVNDSLFPVGSRGFMSFSVILDAVFDINENGAFLHNIHGALSFNLEILDGLLVNTFHWNDTELSKVNVGSVVNNTPYRLNITFIHTDDGFSLLYYMNGILVGKSMLNLDAEQQKSFASESKELQVLGGPLLIDTLKVYYLDSNNKNNIYPDNLADSNSDNPDLVLAEGFNSLTIPSNVKGSASIDGEILKLGDGSVLDYTNLLHQSNDYTLEVVCESGSSFLLQFEGTESGISLNLNDSFVFKKRSDSYLLNDRLLKSWTGNITGFKIISENSVLLNSITLVSRDKSFE